ncbi:RluA family pseudouridine synthase [Eubacteriales bacterium OttesenSCG-928-G02]|nr:RluA family pseudouridine synthase [Eubacteriales bacterium OttesenSCG-928-G02]
MKEIIINKNDSNQRIDKFLSKRFKTMPTSLIYKYLRTKRIKVNGKKVKENTILNEGDILTLFISDEFFEETTDKGFMSLNHNLKIAYEDENLIIVEKPSGIIVHSDDKEDINTLINHIKSYLYDKSEYDPDKENAFAPSLCNRIDRNTEGLVIAAKNAASLKEMNDIIKDREVEKLYLAAVHGFFDKDSGQMTSYLEKNEKENKVYSKKRPDKNTKTAVLEYKVLSKNRDLKLSLVEIKLQTGRTHQIRVQMADSGHPLLGDGKYSINKKDRALGYRSQALCAYSLKFKLKSERKHLGYINGLSIKIDKPEFVKLFY